MRFLALILIIVVFCAALIFTYQNKDQTAALAFGSYRTEPMPIFMVILGSFWLAPFSRASSGLSKG